MARAVERMAEVLAAQTGLVNSIEPDLRSRPACAPRLSRRTIPERRAMPDTAAAVRLRPEPRARASRRHPERAHYDRDTVFAILDAALMCHIGYVIDGLPYVTPTLFWRDGERLYWHGSSASRMLRTQAKGIPVCLTVGPCRRADPGALGVSPFAELPRGDGVRHRGDRRRPGAKRRPGSTPLSSASIPAAPAIMRGDRAAGAEGDEPDRHGHRGGLGQDPRRRPARPRRGLRRRLLGRDDPDLAAHWGGDPGPWRAAAQRRRAGDRPFRRGRRVRPGIVGARPPGEE